MATTKKKPSAKQLAARAKFAAMARARAKAAKGKKKTVGADRKKKSTNSEYMPVFNPYMPDVDYSSRVKKAARKAKPAAKKQSLTAYNKEGKKVKVYIPSKIDGVKPKARKTPARRSSIKKEGHIDTKSHNVRISVVSGINKSALKQIDDLLLEQIKANKWIKYYEEEIFKLRTLSALPANVKKRRIVYFRDEIKKWKQMIAFDKKQINALKKFIK